MASSRAELESRKVEEYQMQLFGLHSRTVSAAINQKIKENVDTRCQKLYSSIEGKYNLEGKEKILLSNNIKDLRNAYLQNMEPHLITVKNVVDKFICIPSNVLLEEDKCQEIQYSDKEFQDLEKKLENLQTQAKRVTIFNAALKEELEIIEKIQESEDLAKELIHALKKGLRSKKLSTKTLRAIEKCKGLKESIDSIKEQTEKDIYNPALTECELEDLILDE